MRRRGDEHKCSAARSCSVTRTNRVLRGWCRVCAISAGGRAPPRHGQFLALARGKSVRPPGAESGRRAAVIHRIESARRGASSLCGRWSGGVSRSRNPPLIRSAERPRMVCLGPVRVIGALEREKAWKAGGTARARARRAAARALSALGSRAGALSALGASPRPGRAGAVVGAISTREGWISAITATGHVRRDAGRTCAQCAAVSVDLPASTREAGARSGPWEASEEAGARNKRNKRNKCSPGERPREPEQVEGDEAPLLRAPSRGSERARRLALAASSPRASPAGGAPGRDGGAQTPGPGRNCGGPWRHPRAPPLTPETAGMPFAKQILRG